MKNIFSGFIVVLLSSGCLFGQNFWQATQNSQLSPPVSSLVCDSSETVFAGTDNVGVFKTTDKGSHWSGGAIAQGVGATQTLAIDTTGNILAGSANVLYRSTNGGTTWSVLNNAMGNYIFSIIVDAQNIIYAGVHDGGVLRSTNGGSTWTAANNGSNNPDDAISFAVTNSALFAATSNGIFRSTDHGGTWITANGNLKAYISEVAGGMNETLCVGTDSGVYISTNAGELWTVSTNGLDTGIFISKIIMDQNNDIYIATYGKGIYRSDNSGATWSAINSGLNDLNINDLAISRSGFLYAATDSGVFRSAIPIISGVEENKTGTITGMNIINTFTIYPNPSISSGAISFSLNAQAHVSLTVSDILGNVVAVLVNNAEQEPGGHSAELNANGLKAGTFFCTLSAGSERKTLLIQVEK
jgi:photosystem II stability/assembly factor-like uncharacterized protein